MTYLTPDERASYKWLSNLDKVDDLLASHAALDEMAHKMREHMFCVQCTEWAGSMLGCTGAGCTIAREYDEMIGGCA